jgi:nicotinamidase-related amidase
MFSFIDPKDTLLLIIDIQEKFQPVLNNFDRVLDNSKKLIKAANLLDIPIIVTEQYPKGLGKTVRELEEELAKHEKIEKISFDCFRNKKFQETIGKKEVKNLVICGIESHVCVYQTCLSALENNFNVYLIADAVSSRKKSDYDIALRSIEKQGANLSTTEMIIFQMITDAKDQNFKALSNIVK